jgi:hypothetical protein
MREGKMADVTEKLASAARRLDERFSTSRGEAIALVMLVALASGCAHRQVYEEPTGNDIATWRVENESQFWLQVYTYRDPASCSGSGLIVIDAGNGKNTVHSALRSDMEWGGTLEVSVKSGDRFYFRLSGSRAGRTGFFINTIYSCSFAGSFEPVPGGIYVVRFEAPSETNCSLRFAEQAFGPDLRPAYRPVKSFQRHPECETSGK